MSKFTVNKDTDDEGNYLTRQNPFLLVQLNGDGCCLSGCNCSPPNFISVFDGKNGIEVSLTDKEVDIIKNSSIFKKETEIVNEGEK